jgi:hypothetical protein
MRRRASSKGPGIGASPSAASPRSGLGIRESVAAIRTARSVRLRNSSADTPLTLERYALSPDRVCRGVRGILHSAGGAELVSGGGGPRHVEPSTGRRWLPARSRLLLSLERVVRRRLANPELSDRGGAVSSRSGCGEGSEPPAYALPLVPTDKRLAGPATLLSGTGRRTMVREAEARFLRLRRSRATSLA